MDFPSVPDPVRCTLAWRSPEVGPAVSSRMVSMSGPDPESEPVHEEETNGAAILLFRRRKKITSSHPKIPNIRGRPYHPPHAQYNGRLDHPGGSCGVNKPRSSTPSGTPTAPRLIRAIKEGALFLLNIYLTSTKTFSLLHRS
jgi:hypothetical protein